MPAFEICLSFGFPDELLIDAADKLAVQLGAVRAETGDFVVDLLLVCARECDYVVPPVWNLALGVERCPDSGKTFAAAQLGVDGKRPLAFYVNRLPALDQTVDVAEFAVGQVAALFIRVAAAGCRPECGGVHFELGIPIDGQTVLVFVFPVRRRAVLGYDVGGNLLPQHGFSDVIAKGFKGENFHWLMVFSFEISLLGCDHRVVRLPCLTSD